MLFLLICSVSARNIYLNWGGSMVHLADALPGKKRPQIQSQLSCFLSLSVIFGKSPNFSGSQLYPLQSLEVSSVRLHNVHFNVSTK